MITHGRAVTAEFTATALLACAVVGSGIMGDRLSAGNSAIALLANSIATGAALLCLILAFGPISGAHMNPVVTVAAASQGRLQWARVPGYIAAQIAGAFTGVWSAHLMFGEPLLSLSSTDRSGVGQMFSEAIATFGLLCVIWGCIRSRPEAAPVAVSAYITGAYWFTSSTSFANPAVTMGRAVTDTFTGIQPSDVPAFVVAQIVGACAATLLFRWLSPPP